MNDLNLKVNELIDYELNNTSRKNKYKKLMIKLILNITLLIYI